MPRKSGRDRITFQDSILISLFLSGKPFNVSLLLIRNMNHSVSHDSKLLPYPALLTIFFHYFHIINESDFSEKISTVFDNSILAANSLVVNSENVLVFNSVLVLLLVQHLTHLLFLPPQFLTLIFKTCLLRLMLIQSLLKTCVCLNLLFKNLLLILLILFIRNLISCVYMILRLPRLWILSLELYKKV